MRSCWLCSFLSYCLSIRIHVLQNGHHYLLSCDWYIILAIVRNMLSTIIEYHVYAEIILSHWYVNGVTIALHHLKYARHGELSWLRNNKNNISSCHIVIYTMYCVCSTHVCVSRRSHQHELDVGADRGHTFPEDATSQR